MRYRIRDQIVVLPDDHLLPTYQKNSPTYDMVFDPIYKAVGNEMPDRYFVDVGANIGDTAVVMRHNAMNPILCIEGHEPFLDCLRRNTRELANVSIAPTFVAVDGVTTVPLHFVSQRGTGAFTVASAEEGAAALPSKPLALLLEEAGALRKGIAVFKTDTDGMDALILRDFLRIDIVPAALFFEFDVRQTIPKQGAEDAWRSVFDTLRSRGYSLVIFDNFGYQMGTCSPASYELVWELNKYVEAQFRHQFVHTYYLDIWAFPPTMSSIFEECRSGGPLRNLPGPNQLVTDMPSDRVIDHPVTTVLECPKCGTLLSGLACIGCNTRYETVLGIPFIGDFEGEDVLGLIEIAANASRRINLAMPSDEVERLDALCAAYHAASDKAAFKESNEAARVFHFDYRYNEWLAVTNLLQGIDLTDRDVLDVGAGQGVDAKRLSLKGARITALEFSPILAEAGKSTFPELNWVGGFGHALPFPASSFDFVFINAALHHMRSVPDTIAEALRVLRPGGMLITSGDPFRSDDAGAKHEFDVFDRHEAVLSGINEQCPPVADLLTTLERNREILKTEIFSQIMYGGVSGTGPDLTEWTPWDLDRDGDLLKRRGVGLATRIRLTAPWPHPRLVQGQGILSPATFAAWLDEPETVIARLARIMPRDNVDRPFPGEPSKFDLLNGWRVARSTDTTRTGYERARLFRTRRADARALRFEIRSPVPTEFLLLVNARQVGNVNAGADWTKAVVDVSSVDVGDVFVLEFRRKERATDFDNGCFDVRLLSDARGLKSIVREWFPNRLVKRPSVRTT